VIKPAELRKGADLMTAELSPANRERMIDQMTRDEVDVLVVGGG